MDAREDLITTKQVAAMCRVGYRTVQRWLADGTIRPYIRVARTIRFRREDILKLAEDRELGAPSPSGEKDDPMHR